MAYNIIFYFSDQQRWDTKWLLWSTFEYHTQSGPTGSRRREV